MAEVEKLTPVTSGSIEWSRQYSFNRPSFVYSRKQSKAVNSESFSPLSYAKRFSVMGQQVIRSFVPILFDVRCPAAIAWFIVAVVVGIAINGVSRAWTIAHVGYEILKFHPRLTNRNPTSAVEMPALGARVCASLNNRVPCLIFRSSTQSVLRGRAIALCRNFGVSATATRRKMASKISGRYYSHLSTLAQAVPVVVVPASSGVGHYSPPIELPISEVMKPFVGRNFSDHRFVSLQAV